MHPPLFLLHNTPSCTRHHPSIQVAGIRTDPSAALLPPPLQAASVGVGFGRLALSACGCALLAQMDAAPPTLASLVGALDMAASPAAAGAAAAAQQPSGLAQAARLALHADDLATLTAPGGGGGGGVLLYRLAAADDDASELLTPVALTWTQPGVQGMAAAEAEAWAAAAASAGASKGHGEAHFLQVLRRLLQQAQELRAPLSRGLLSALLSSAAGEAGAKCAHGLKGACFACGARRTRQAAVMI
jgi:hypothetical protein